MALTPAQIMQLAYNAGFRGVDLIRATAIALAESGGNPQAYNPETAAGTQAGSGSRGLWQIYGTAHPQYNNASAFDPATNARAAYQVYREAGGKFTPWTTWTKGVANQYLSQLQGIKINTSSAAARSQETLQSVARLTGTTAAQAAAGVGTGVKDTGGDIASIVPGIVERIIETARNSILGKNAKGEQRETADLGFFLAGAALILIGLVFLFINSDTGKNTIELSGEAIKTVAIPAGLSKVI